jgi:hypothetical protein
VNARVFHALFLTLLFAAVSAGRAAAEDITLDDPKGSKNVGTVDGGRVLNIKGKVGTLTIGVVNGRSTVDISGLEAGSVQIGLVDGASTVNIELKVEQGTGTVTFTDRIDGGSKVAVKTAGNVTIAQRLDNPNSKLSICTWGDVRIGDRIDGGSTVTVHMCRNFTVGNRIDNPNTTVNVTYFGEYSAKRANGNVNPKQVQKPKELPCN